MLNDIVFFIQLKIVPFLILIHKRKLIIQPVNGPKHLKTKEVLETSVTLL